MISEAKKTCINCTSVFYPKRNPNQKYCSQGQCQNTRKTQWRKDKCKNDADYKENQNTASKRWRKRNGHYWSEYRKNHPEYTEDNKNKQKERNLKRRPVAPPHKRDALMIANSDALPIKNSIIPGVYKLSPHDSMIANSDVLIVNIAIISDGYKNCGVIHM